MTLAGLVADQARRAAIFLGASLVLSCDTNASTDQTPNLGSGSGGPATAVFASDWSTARGSSREAVSDGGRWPEVVCPNFAEVLSVVPGSQAGWTRTPNVLRVTNRGSRFCGQVETRTQVPEGESFYIRMFVRVDDENQLNFHPVTLNCCGTIEASPWAIFAPEAGVSYRPKLNFTMTGSGNQRWFPPPVPQGAWYRFEWHIEFVDVDQRRFRMWPRIYDMNGSLLYDADDYENIDSREKVTLGPFYAAGGTATFNNLDLARRFGIGYEGNAVAKDQGRKWYFADVAICLDDWCGDG